MVSPSKIFPFPDNEALMRLSMKRRQESRWLVLCLACLTNFGASYCFDNPQPLEIDIESYLNVSHSQFNMLYSFYAIPNLIIPFISGVIIDLFGAGNTFACLAGIVVFGQLTVTSGVYYSNFSVMLLGRFILGVGLESLSVARSTILAKWFVHKELGLALGIALSTVFAANSLNSFIATKIFKWTGELYSPFLVGSILCMISFILSLIVAEIDKKTTEQRTSTRKRALNMFKCRGLKELGFDYYLLIFSSFFLYGALFGVRNNLSGLLVEKFDFSPERAGFWILFVYLIPTVLTPFIGAYVDKTGRRTLTMLYFAIMFVLEVIYLTFASSDTPHPWFLLVPGVMGIGVFHSGFGVIFWSSIPLVLKTQDTGLAYGMAAALQNLIEASVPILVGFLHDKTQDINKGYFWSLVPLIILGIMGILDILWLYYEDKSKEERLNSRQSLKPQEIELIESPTKYKN